MRNRLLLAGVLWGFVLAASPAILAFDDPFTVSPFLVAAHLCASFSVAIGALFAGRWVTKARREPGWRKTSLIVSGAGVVQGLVAAPLAAISIWAAMAINMSGFSVESSSEVSKVFRVFQEPAIWRESFIVAVAVLTYAVVVGMLFFPFTGAAIYRLVGYSGGRPS